ncbi:MAG: hypothetical protein NTU94_12885 [Planctomycetota bacterium]|nr:hypothetical protein [Planctomycetota bacterium]
MDKRVLILGYWFYPSTQPGAHRIGKMVKYLPRHGWSPTVLCAECTPENSGLCYDPLMAARGDPCETVRIPHNPDWGKTRLGRALEWAQLWCENVLHPYHEPAAFFRRMLAAAERLVARTQFDALWASGKPWVVHAVASEISRRHRIPWIAEFRDLADQFSDGWIIRRTLREEMRVCSTARALVVVSPMHVKRLESRHRIPVHLIYNGFDPADYTVAEAVNQEKFVIGFFGSVYLDRDPRPLFKALDLLRQDPRVRLADIAIRFYGPRHYRIDRFLAGYDCQDVVKWHPRVPYAEMVRLLKRCAILLLLKGPGVWGAVTSNIFVYLGARRPILNVPGDGNVVDGLLAETQGGISLGEPQRIADAIAAWYQEWKATGTVQCRSLPEVVARYSRERQAEQVARLLDSIIGQPMQRSKGGAPSVRQLYGVQRD